MDAFHIGMLVLCILWGVVCFGLTYKYLADAAVLRAIEMGGVSKKDDQTVIQQIISLVTEAQSEIEIFDDGELSKFLYRDTAFVGCVRRRLTEDRDFKVRVFFDSSVPSGAFAELCKDFPDSVTVWRRARLVLAGDVSSAVYFHLIDRGTKGVFKKQSAEDGLWRYRSMDISSCSESDKKKAGAVVLRKYRQPEELFKRVGAWELG